MSVAAVILPPFQAVAAMDRASMRHTAANWPSPGLEPSRLGKFRVVWRRLKPLLAGTSPAPKQGPQKLGLMTALSSRSAVAPILVSSRLTGTLVVHVQSEVTVAAAAAPEDVGRLGNVVEQPAGAAGDDTLIGPDAAVTDFVRELHMGLRIPLLGVRLHSRQDVGGVLQELVDGPGVGGVEGQGDHGLHLGEVDLDVLVVVGSVRRVQSR